MEFTFRRFIDMRGTKTRSIVRTLWGRLSCNKLAIFFAILIGLIYVSHYAFNYHFDFNNSHSTSYPITEIGRPDDAIAYYPRAKEAFEGRWLIGDVNNYEYRDSPAFLSIASPLLLGWLGRALGSFEAGVILADFVFPALIFLAVFAIAKELTGRKTASLFFAAVFLLVPAAFQGLPPTSFASLSGFFQALFPFQGNALLYFSRIEYPKLTFLFYGMTVLFTLRALNRGAWRDAVLAGIGFGSLFYTYFYDWTAFTVTLGLFLIYVLFLRRLDIVVKVVAIGCIGILCSIPFWMNFYQLQQLASYGDLLQRLDVEQGRFLRWKTVWQTYIKLGILGGTLWLSRHKAKRISTAFVITGLFTYFITVNVQLVLGYSPQPDHWYRTVLLYLALAFFLLALHIVDAPRLVLRSWFKPLAWFLLCVFLGIQLLGQYQFSLRKHQNYLISEDILQSYRWLDEHVPKDAVIGSLSVDSASGIALHSNKNVFLQNGFNTVAPTSEIWKRAMFMANVYGLDTEAFRAYIQDAGIYFFTAYYTDRGADSMFLANRSTSLPRAVEQKAQEYHQIFRSASSRNAIPYKLDYLYYGPEDRRIGNSPSLNLDGLVKVYEHGGVEIFQLTN